MIKTATFVLSLFLLPPALAQTRLIQVPTDAVRTESTPRPQGTDVWRPGLRTPNRTELSDIGGLPNVPKSGDTEDYVAWMYRYLQNQKMEQLGQAALKAPYVNADRKQVKCLETPGAFGFPDAIGEGAIGFNCMAGTSQQTLNYVLDYTATLTVSPSGCANHDQLRAFFQVAANRNARAAEQYVRTGCVLRTSPMAVTDANNNPMGFGSARVDKATGVHLKFANEQLERDPELAAYVNRGVKPKAPAANPGFSNPLKKLDGSVLGKEPDEEANTQSAE